VCVLQSVGLGVAVLVGAGTQRITGLGFALVASPFVVLLLGPFNGVLVINVCGTVTALVVLTQVWRDVDVRRAGLLLGPAVPAVLPGAWVARNLAAPVLAVVVGGLVLVALVAVVASEKARVLRGRRGAVIAGMGSGFLNVTVGAGGPAIAVYAVSTGWPHRRFAATAQLIFAVLSALSLAAKGGRPSLAAAGWMTVAAGLVIGIAVGNRLAGRVPAERARYAVVALAIAGAAMTVCRGLAGL
jgi:uncharacterized membrane protein YfcA